MRNTESASGHLAGPAEAKKNLEGGTVYGTPRGRVRGERVGRWPHEQAERVTVVTPDLAPVTHVTQVTRVTQCGLRSQRSQRNQRRQRNPQGPMTQCQPRPPCQPVSGQPRRNTVRVVVIRVGALRRYRYLVARTLRTIECRSPFLDVTLARYGGSVRKRTRPRGRRPEIGRVVRGLRGEVDSGNSGRSRFRVRVRIRGAEVPSAPAEPNNGEWGK
jgi:hypothetical protein